MKEKLWSFTDSLGSFQSGCAHKFKTLYFPLANERIMSSVSSDLHGDIKSSQGEFLLVPVSRIDLVNLRSSRNFWICIDKNKIWSATGVSKDNRQIIEDDFKLEAGLLWHKITRKNRAIGLKAEILSFVPVQGEPLEVMQVKITNFSRREIKFTPFAAIPLYCRGANNLRDHRHVTSLLQRIVINKFGIISQPTLSFDETGHRKNDAYYFVLGWDDKARAPQCLYPTQEMFCGQAGDLEAPQSVMENLAPDKTTIQGREPMGALRFKEVVLGPGKSKTYIIVLGISKDKQEISRLISKFSHPKKVEKSLAKTKDYWQGIAQRFNLSTQDTNFDNWFRWVSVQPTLRRIFGCSFLPDFDYGKGGRGWRDLWQDCLSLILSDPQKVRPLILNNFSGVRIDGSNATIIGKGSGEFISDRNNISRTWMDHGIWPLLTLDLYLQETGDYKILFKEVPYFKNHQINRARLLDYHWNPQRGTQLKVKTGKVYRGTVLEHLLIENLVQFFNVGMHNHVRLEGADWNDGLDMASENGESVAFSALYAQNLNTLAQLLIKINKPGIKVIKEIKPLLRKFNYDSVSEKLRILNNYFSSCASTISGKKISLDTCLLAQDLKDKSRWMMQHIRKKEWLKQGFFNGYYNNDKERLEGNFGGRIRMCLASQVFPIMSQTASAAQIQEILKSAKRYLWDKKLGGYHLNTDFKEEQHNLGRAFSFVYGDKENGACFNHMVVMFAYALYKRGYAKEGWRVLNSIYRMAVDTEKSRIYPCLPEYFDLEGRGMYAYLTGSASWFVLTLLTQVFGIRGKEGDLLIEPKLSKEQFLNSTVIKISKEFCGHRLEVSFTNSQRLDYPEYRIKKVTLDSNTLPLANSLSIIIKRQSIKKLSQNKIHRLEIILGC